jgi:hypothetical protein
MAIALLTAGMCIFSSELVFSQKKNQQFPQWFRFVVQPQSEIVIDGTTNVNTYQCSLKVPGFSDTLVLVQKSDSLQPEFIKGNIRVKASDFDCVKKVISDDFKKTVHAEKYPHISITFLNFAWMPRLKAGNEQIRCRMRISIAGTATEFDLTINIRKEKGYIYLTGGREFTFSEFNLQPPDKMLGLIKTDEKLKVNFNLKLIRMKS